MSFSRRSAWDRSPNLLARQLQARHEAALEVLDLTHSNPTTCGLPYSNELLAPLADPASLVYSPEPLGMLSAREAIAQHYAERGVRVSPEQILLTASTSEAYSFLFKLLADPGDVVAIPSPSYPLFDFLAELDGVQLVPYRLSWDGSWSLDLESARELLRIHRDVRALLLVSPHNPTGHCVTRAEQDALIELAKEHAVALVADEVFADYVFAESSTRAPSLAARSETLSFTLSGLSKVVGLPQLKLGWMVASGPEPERREAMERLEIIADTYLSVATPVQHALPKLLRSGETVRSAILDRLRRNRAQLEAARPTEATWDVLRSEAGWYALLQVSRTRSEEEWCRASLDEGVWVHPGYFFDFERKGLLVISLLTEETIFDRALPRLVKVLGS
jgi:aspartate/methionine/tyrosine aminotransferase